MKNSFLNLFNEWLDSKKSRPENTWESYPYLKLVTVDTDWTFLFKSLNHIIKIKTSYMDGLKILELSTEILLINPNQYLFDEMFDKNKNSETWIKQLQALRFPLTTARDEQQEQKMIKLSWPVGSKVKFERRGDRSGVELKYFITSPADMIKLISSLERVYAEMNQDLHNSHSEIKIN